MNELRGFKFVTNSVLIFKKTINEDATSNNTFYLNSEAETIIQDLDIDNLFVSNYSTIITKIKNIKQKNRVGLLIQ